MDDFYLQPVFAAIWTAVIVIAFVVVFARILDNLKHIRAYRRELLLNPLSHQLKGTSAR